MVQKTEWHRPTTLTEVASATARTSDRQRVRVVEEPGIRADLVHVPGDAEDDRDGAQGAEDATDADRVGDRVAQAEAGRDVEVDLGRAGAADLDRVDDEVGTTERLAPVKMGRDRRLGVERRGGPAGHPLGGREPLGVDVVEDDVRGPEGRATTGCRRGGSS